MADDTYKAIDADFQQAIEALVAAQAYEHIQYFSDIHEFFTTRAILRELRTQDEAAYLILATGEAIRLDRLVRIGDLSAPGYDEDYFKCDLPR
ncbi:hypothetical protein [Pontibacter chitinilyticus]|uniref:hypothetical protein n=1 Tax=Pontibacter chitinilyticus TaxID=2674989 RepID=UPI00321A95CF